MKFELPKDRAFVIAEAGTCHASASAGDRLDKAMRYVLAARDAGADCIKFQMFGTGDLFCGVDGDEQRKHRWNASILDFGQWYRVKEYAEACGLVFLASVFQHSAVEMLTNLGVSATKVASRAALRFPYGDSPEPYLISTGMGLAGAVEAAHHFLECEASYPSTKRWRGEAEGFSDHSGTPWRAIDAISRGCKLIEVHFFMDPLDAGPDLPASLDTSQLSLVCEARDALAELRSIE